MKREHKGVVLVYTSLSIITSAQMQSFAGFIVIGLFFMLAGGMKMIVD